MEGLHVDVDGDVDEPPRESRYRNSRAVNIEAEELPDETDATVKYTAGRPQRSSSPEEGRKRKCGWSERENEKERESKGNNTARKRTRKKKKKEGAARAGLPIGRPRSRS